MQKYREKKNQQSRNLAHITDLAKIINTMANKKKRNLKEVAERILREKNVKSQE